MIIGSPSDRNLVKLISFYDKYNFMPVFGSGTALQQPVFVWDVAKSLAQCFLSNESIGRCLAVSGKEAVSYCSMVHAIADSLSLPYVQKKIPEKPFYYLLRLAEKCSFAFLPLRSEQILRMNEDKSIDHSEIALIIQFNPVSLSSILEYEVNLYRQVQSESVDIESLPRLCDVNIL